MPQKKSWSSHEAHRISGPERGPATEDEKQGLSDMTTKHKRHSKKATYSERKTAEEKATRWKPKKEKKRYSQREGRRSKNVIDESRSREDRIKSLIEELDRKAGR